MNGCCSTDRGQLAVAEERRRQQLADAASGRATPGGKRTGSALGLAIVMLVVIAISLLSAACRSHPAGAAPENAYLEQALAQMPADVARFAFTDWRRVRRYHDFQGNSKLTARDERVAYMLDVMKMTQAAAHMDSAHFLFQAQNWGWDSTDLLWEAQAHRLWLTESVFILRFRDDFDFAPLYALLRERRFLTTSHRGRTVHAVPLGRNPDWHYRSHLAHHALAIIPDEKLLIMAATPDPIHHVLAVRAGADSALLDQPAVVRALDPLRDHAAVEMHLGTNICRRFGRGPSPGMALTPYNLLAAGYLYEGERQSDLLLFHYEDERQAATDLNSRRTLLESGASRKREVTYGREFAVEEAAVDGPLMRFHLAPTAALRRSTGWPQTLLGWIQDGDARFAACSRP